MPLPVPWAAEREKHELARHKGERFTGRFQRDLQGLLVGPADLGDRVVVRGHDEPGEQLPVGVGRDADRADSEVDDPQQRRGVQRGTDQGAVRDRDDQEQTGQAVGGQPSLVARLASRRIGPGHRAALNLGASAHTDSTRRPSSATSPSPGPIPVA